MFLLSVWKITSLLEDELLVTLWTDILGFSLHVKLLLELFYLCENLSHSLFFDCENMPLECLHSGLGLTLSECFSDSHACWDMI